MLHLSDRLAKIINSILILTIISSFLTGCVRYASEEEMKFLNERKKVIYSLELEVKELKERQIEIVNKKYQILREIEKCKDSSSSKDTSETY